MEDMVEWEAMEDTAVASEDMVEWEAMAERSLVDMVEWEDTDISKKRHRLRLLPWKLKHLLPLHRS